jgi:hypothetical protein
MPGSAILTEYIYPPVPTRNYDWRAWFEGTEESGPYGRGKTERDAIANLLEQI